MFLAKRSDLARQTTTMGTIRQLATAIMLYENDMGLYPVANDISDLVNALGVDRGRVATYLRSDGWGHEFLIRSDHSSYTIISLGRDGALQPDPPGGKTGDKDADIIYVDGTFIQYPEGPQR